MQRTLEHIRNGWKNRAGVFACFLLTLCCFLLISTCPAFAKTLTVDGQGWADYRSIQAAVDQAEKGDTVFVYAGEYNENVLVDKGLTLIAENRDISSESPAFEFPEFEGLDISKVSEITAETDEITDELLRLGLSSETLIYIPPSIKKASSASLLLILDASGQIDLLEEIEKGPFSESEKLVLKESVREIRRKCPITFVRRDKVVYSYLISPDRKSEGKIAGSFVEAGLENFSEFLSENLSYNNLSGKNFSENISGNLSENVLSAPPSVRVCLTENENCTLDRIQEVSPAYWEFSQRTRVLDLKDTDFGPEEVDNGIIEYGNTMPDTDPGKFLILKTGLSDYVFLIPAEPDVPALEINADNVTTRGFVIKPDWGGRPEAGLLLLGVGNCTLSKNRVSGMERGIFLRNCTDCVLEGNLLDSNIDALVLENSNINLLRANIMERGSSGIYLKASDENRLFENRAEDFSSGFRIEGSRENTIESNTASCNSWAGFYLLGAEENRLGNNSAHNNLQCGMSLENSAGNTLSRNDVWNNIHGIYLEVASSENTIHDNQLFECEKGLFVSKDSTKDRIYNNTIRLGEIRHKSWINDILDQISI